MSNFKFFENEADEGATITSTTVAPQVSSRSELTSTPAIAEESARYRVEQMTMTRTNDIVQSHAETRREFVVKRTTTTNGLVVSVALVENIIDVYPEVFKKAIILINDVDLVKSEIHAQVDMATGKIYHILNHQQIIEKWKQLRAELTNRFSFLRDHEAKNNILKFLTVSESIIANKKNLIEDLNTKLFFELFFDKYLVTDNTEFEPYTRTFYSQLFEGETATLDFTQTLTGETPETVNLTKTGLLKLDSFNKSEIEYQYEKKYKPLIKYRFSEYNVKIIDHTVLDTAGKWIKNADVSIVEEVKNNVSILVDYKLRKIE